MGEQKISPCRMMRVKQNRVSVFHEYGNQGGIAEQTVSSLIMQIR